MIGYFLYLLTLLTVLLHGTKVKQLFVRPSYAKDMFTTAAVDKIDHNPSSTTSHDSFHGIAISLVEHSTSEKLGSERAVDTFDPAQCTREKNIAQLLSCYRDVPPVTLPSSELYAPPITDSIQSSPITATHGKDLQKDSLVNVKELLRCHPTNVQLSHFFLCFLENAHSLAMILYSMNVIRSTVHGPTQVPVIAVDQSLFALAKQIQWRCANSHGENNFVFMLGCLHIEMTAFKVLGKWLNGSGWTDVMSNAGVATQGVADSFISASHLTRTRHAHHITAASL